MKKAKALTSSELQEIRELFSELTASFLSTREKIKAIVGPLEPGEAPPYGMMILMMAEKDPTIDIRMDVYFEQRRMAALFRHLLEDNSDRTAIFRMSIVEAVMDYFSEED